MGKGLTRKRDGIRSTRRRFIACPENDRLSNATIKLSSVDFSEESVYSLFFSSGYIVGKKSNAFILCISKNRF